MALNDFANMSASEILDKLEFVDAPFDPFEIAEQMGIKVVKTLDWDKIVSIKDGHIYLAGDTPEIWINPLRPYNRQKFTLAHELGHLVYDVLPEIASGKQGFTEYHRNDNKGAHETRANRFAANLLMPIFAIERAVRAIHESGEGSTDRYIDGLESIFEVSKQAVIVRLKALKVISQDYEYKYI